MRLLWLSVPYSSQQLCLRCRFQACLCLVPLQTVGLSLAGVGTEPTNAPPSRQVKAYHDVQATHPAFKGTAQAGSAPPAADTGQAGDNTVTDMQS